MRRRFLNNIKSISDVDYSKEYFTIEALEDGVLILDNNHDTSYDGIFTNLMISADGVEWENFAEVYDNRICIEIPVGLKLFLKNDGLINGNSSFPWLYSDQNTPYIISGNIMSLVYGDDFIGKTELIQNYCFARLFAWDYGNSLVSAEHLILPATTLTNGCYQSMFYNCISLTTAPELPATILASNCYQYMFEDCSNLNKITMLATDISASGCLSGWVSGVASSGTFVKNAAMTSLPSGASGIPNGWTVVNDTSKNLITFKIEGTAYTEYQAEEGMTWEEWVESEYANGNYTVTRGYIGLNNGIGLVSLNQNNVSKNDVIIKDTVYIINTHIGGGSD